jgi:uncharacterized membrane protein
MFDPIRITFKRKFLAGLVITVPVTLTIVVVASLFKFIDGMLGQFFDLFLGRHIAGLGFITAVGIIFLVGIISTNVFGKRVLGLVEKLFLNIPVFSSIYTALKQLVDAFSPESKGSFKKFVIIEYPRSGCYAFGFLTKECTVRSDKQDTRLKTVYIPTNNLYLGEIVLLNDSSIIYTNIPIEEGIRIVLSGGTATPNLIFEAKEGA